MNFYFYCIFTVLIFFFLLMFDFGAISSNAQAFAVSAQKSFLLVHFWCQGWNLGWQYARQIPYLALDPWFMIFTFLIVTIVMVVIGGIKIGILLFKFENMWILWICMWHPFNSSCLSYILGNIHNKRNYSFLYKDVEKGWYVYITPHISILLIQFICWSYIFLFFL